MPHLESGDHVHSHTEFILKRIRVSMADELRFSALREVHFGAKLRGEEHVTRFVEHFEDEENGIMWLVFHNEGISLQVHFATFLTLNCTASTFV